METHAQRAKGVQIMGIVKQFKTTEDDTHSISRPMKR
jgi:hypothetical protein